MAARVGLALGVGFAREGGSGLRKPVMLRGPVMVCSRFGLRARSWVFRPVQEGRRRLSWGCLIRISSIILERLRHAPAASNHSVAEDAPKRPVER